MMNDEGTSDFGPWTSDITLQTSDIGPRTSEVSPFLQKRMVPAPMAVTNTAMNRVMNIFIGKDMGKMLRGFVGTVNVEPPHSRAT